MNRFAGGAILVVATLLTWACARPATTPPPVEAKSPDRATAELFADLLMGSHGVLEAPKLERYAQSVAARVVRASGYRGHWQVRLTDDPEPAANAVPGGTLLVSRGALAHLSSEAELAAVIAHELAHLVMGHTDLTKTALPAHFEEGPTRAAAQDADEERQADALAVGYVARAGYDPRAVGSALAGLHRATAYHCKRELGRDDCDDAHDVDDPHPPRPARLARVALAAGSQGGEVGRHRYLAAIDGLELEGARASVESGRFRSANGLTFAIPEGFSPTLSGNVLTAKAMGTELVVLGLRGRLLTQAARDSIRSAPYSSREIAGTRALIGSFGDDRQSRVALLVQTPIVHVIAVSGSNRDEHLERILASVRPAAARPRPLIRVIRSAGSARFRDVVARHCPEASLAQLTALNGIEADETVERHLQLKCVVTK